MIDRLRSWWTRTRASRLLILALVWTIGAARCPAVSWRELVNLAAAVVAWRELYEEATQRIAVRVATAIGKALGKR